MNRLRGQAGFTLAEIMVGSTLFMLLSGGLMMFVSSFDNLRYEFQTKLAMTNYARIALSRMVSGSQATDITSRQGMWEAQSFDIVSENEFTYTDTAGADHDIRMNGQNIERRDNNAAWVTLYDPNGDLPDDPGRYLTELQFLETDEPSVVEIRLNVGERNGGRWHNVSITTNVAFRN